MTLVESGDIVDVEIADRVVPARVLATDVEARYGRGPEALHRVEVPGSGTWTVTDDEVLA